jgi:peroxiredoxin
MEMPDLNKLVEKYKNKEVVFLGLAMNQKEKLEQFLKRTKYNYIIVPDAKDVVEKYSVTSFPTHMVIDKNANILFAVSGLGPTTIDDLDNMISNLIK